MALSKVTFKELEFQIRGETGANDTSKPNSDTIRRWANVIVNKIAMLTAPIDGAWGRGTTVLTMLNATGVAQDPSEGGSYTAATNTLDLPGAFDETYVGGWVFIEDRSNSRGLYAVIDEVVSGNAVLRFIVGTGAEADISDANLLAIAKPNPAFYNGANLNSLSVRDLVKVVDGTNGNVVRLDSDQFAAFADNPNYDDSMGVEYAGESVHIATGTNLTIGTLTATFNEKPDNIASATTEIDILPEHLPLLKAEVSRWVLNFIEDKSGRLEAIGNPMSALEDKFKKYASDMSARLSRAGVPAKRN